MRSEGPAGKPASTILCGDMWRPRLPSLNDVDEWWRELKEVLSLYSSHALADHGTDGCVGPKTVQVACKVSKHGNSTLAKRDCIETFPL